MPVLTTPRRITLYWLLLLLPTIAVGAGALFLLRREQQRVAERGAYADEARRAAIAARARLIVENVELLVGEVETALLDTIAAEPAAGLDAFCEQWEKTNPLVRTAFRATPGGQLLRPNPRSTDEDARGFVRRFTRQFAGSPPWAPTPGGPASGLEKREQQQVFDEVNARQEVSKNVAQVQSARRDVQELLKVQNFPPTASSAGALGDRASAPAAVVARNEVRNRATASDRGSFSGASAAGEVKAAAPQVAAAVRAKDVADRSGWTPALIDGRLHVLGWVQPGGAGEVRGVELELVALISKLGGTLPAQLPAGEGYALRDNQSRVLHQVGAIPREGEPVARVPLAPALLPGWDVVAYLLPPSPEDMQSGAGLLGVAILLVGILVAAILAGGSLLLWQARRSEQEAAQKTSFVANVSHEFKTPLTTIRLYSELLEQGRVRDAAQGGEYLRTIGRETQRLARLVNNALDFSRLEQGRKKYARENVDLAAELGRILDTHAPRVGEAGLALSRELPAQPLPVTTDRDALEQIVVNLLDNACKYAVSGGEVRVALTPRARSGAEIRVSDRGPGVPAAHREQIFEKFHRVDDALTAEKTGTGLGLSIARQLARGLGGELRCGERAGGGAEFVLELP